MIEEISVVALRAAHTIGDQVFPVETRGIVVAVYQDGDGLEVEFSHPFQAVVTLTRADVRKVPTLRDVLPMEFHVEHSDSRAARLLNVELAATFNTCNRKWPGSHKMSPSGGCCRTVTRSPGMRIRPEDGLFRSRR